MCFCNSQFENDQDQRRPIKNEHGIRSDSAEGKVAERDSLWDLTYSSGDFLAANDDPLDSGDPTMVDRSSIDDVEYIQPSDFNIA